MPSISVIIPAYNAEKYIGEAIESALNQTRPAHGVCNKNLVLHKIGRYCALAGKQGGAKRFRRRGLTIESIDAISMVRMIEALVGGVG